MIIKSYLSKRIIPCLDVKNGRVVKGVNFVDLSDAGDPVEIAKKYNDNGADEITFLDIEASHKNRSTIVDLIKQVAKEVFIPLTVGGGIRELKDIYNLLNVGCDKVSINSSAIKNPNLINESAKRFGSSTIVVAIDVKKNSNNIWEVFSQGGRINMKIDALKWAKEVYERGAGEILLTSMDRDGTKSGFDNKLNIEVNKIVNIPIIASGGAGKMEDFKDIFLIGKADAALAASVFHFQKIEILALKKYLINNNIPMHLS